MDKSVTLEVFFQEELIFTSTGKWLYPLFDLEIFLKENTYPVEDLIVKDKIVGKASALLLLYLGCKRVHAGILSELAKEVFEANNIEYSFENIVHRISCKTETILEDINDKVTAYNILKERAKR